MRRKTLDEFQQNAEKIQVWALKTYEQDTKKIAGLDFFVFS